MKLFVQSLRMLVVMTILTGVLYPLVVTCLGVLWFPRQVAGSVLVRQGEKVGSSLIAQGFKDPKYFWPRPSAVDFNPLPSGGSNYGPTSKDLAEKINERRTQGLTNDLLYASASGLDPHISPAAALHQCERVAQARQLDELSSRRLSDLVKKYTEGRQFGVLGESRVNVLQLNLALDEEFLH